MVKRNEVFKLMNPSGKSVFIGTWKPVTLEHINVEGEGSLTFNKKKDLQDYCKKHKLRSGALGNDA